MYASLIPCGLIMGYHKSNYIDTLNYTLILTECKLSNLSNVESDCFNILGNAMTTIPSKSISRLYIALSKANKNNTLYIKDKCEVESGIVIPLPGLEKLEWLLFLFCFRGHKKYKMFLDFLCFVHFDSPSALGDLHQEYSPK